MMYGKKHSGKKGSKMKTYKKTGRKMSGKYKSKK